MDVLVEFDRLPWEHPADGVRFKAFRSGAQQLRLLEFSPGFIDDEWCTSGHAVHVLEGALTLEMRRGDRLELKEGDVAFLRVGEEHAHRASAGADRLVRLLLFEVV
jgi:quercetin dioxygenase-like cupin family protein